MTQSKLSLPLALLILFVMACTCGKTGNTNYSNSNSRNSNSSTSNNNESNDNKSSNANSSSDNKNTSSTTADKMESTGIPECDEYMKKIDEYLKCPNIPAESREEWRKTREDTIQRIKQAGQTDAGKSIMAGVCNQMTDAIKDELVKCK
jgi:flagellum-specific peptidoglycan hydrolase FlgJ